MFFIKQVFLIIFVFLRLCWDDKQSYREHSEGRDFFERRIHEKNLDNDKAGICNFLWTTNVNKIFWNNITKQCFLEYGANTTCVGHVDMMESVKMSRSQITTGIEISKYSLNGNNDTHDLWLFVKGTIPKLPIEKHLDSAILILCFCYVKIKHEPTNSNMDHELKNVLDLFSSKIVDFVREAVKNTKQHITKDLYTNYFEPAARHIKCFPLRGENQHMKQEWNRFASFNKFPVDNLDISFIRLSQSGFFYTGDKDIVQCFSCGVTNNEWPHDVPIDDTHRKISPDCPFMTGKDESNIAIHSTNKSSGNQVNSACGSSNDEWSSLNEPRSAPLNRNNLENHNGSGGEITTTGTAKYQEYALKNRRNDTFKEWAFSHIVSSKSLVDCGLFHTGVADCVRCFFCGGGMRNWEHGDVPWIEHARWFPHCQYVKQCKGQEFIEHCLRAIGLESFESPDTTTNQRYTNQQTLFPETVSASTSSIVPIGNNENRTLIKELQEMGFSESSIDEALLQLSNTTDSFIARKEEVIEYLLTSQSSTADHESEQQELSGLFRQPEELNSTITCREQNLSNTDSTEINQKPEAASSNTFKAEQCKTRNGSDEVKQKLSDENELLKQQMICKVCMDNDACMVFLPCGHMVTCTECAHALRKCAICRTVIKGTVRAFMS